MVEPAGVGEAVLEEPLHLALHDLLERHQFLDPLDGQLAVEAAGHFEVELEVDQFVARQLLLGDRNVSSPNTEKLRDLQGKDALGALLNGVLETNAGLSTPIPIFLKIAPDLTPDEIADIADVARETGISGIIATNTTLSRDGLTSRDRGEQGGLSGAPLFEKSTRVLAQLSQLCGPDIPLIGVGGVSTAAQAYEKIRAGASAMQLYTALVYGGLSMVSDIAKGLDTLLERDGFANVADAVGSGRADWL